MNLYYVKREYFYGEGREEKLAKQEALLADRMDEAGTYSLDQWLSAAPRQGNVP